MKREAVARELVSVARELVGKDVLDVVFDKMVKIAKRATGKRVDKKSKKKGMMAFTLPPDKNDYGFIVFVEGRPERFNVRIRITHEGDIVEGGYGLEGGMFGLVSLDEFEGYEKNLMKDFKDLQGQIDKLSHKDVVFDALLDLEDELGGLMKAVASKHGLSVGSLSGYVKVNFPRR